MLLLYLGKLKNQKFALCMHAKPVSSVTFYHLCNRCLPNVMKINVKINSMQYQHFAFCSFTVLNVLKECLITFCVSRRQRKMYCGHARLCVCVSVCVCLSVGVRPHYCTDPDVTWGVVEAAP